MSLSIMAAGDGGGRKAGPAFAALARWLPRVLLAAHVVLPAAGRAETRPVAFVTPGEMKSGALLLKSDQQGRFVEAPRVATDVQVEIAGPVARARVTQRFLNPADGWAEGVYVFPLPDGAAVDTLRMVIGDRVVVGEIKPRQEARRVYEQAKAEGKKASLLEQERPNLFTNQIANIGPGETVVVQIEYQETVRREGDAFAIRVPLVVAPRYHPAPIAQVVEAGSGRAGWVVDDPVPDRERLSPPVLDPAQELPANPVTLAVRLSAGFPLGEVRSHHHAAAIREENETTRLVTLEGAVPADRDFELTWSAKSGPVPSVGLFRERVGAQEYLLAMITPPAAGEASPAGAREVVFVIDNSGSMGGASMEQAKASLLFALSRLKPADRFNIVRFDDTLETLFPDTVPASGEPLDRARRFVAGLSARGGTEMLPALRAALSDPRPTDGSRLRQVVFLTDGAIGNETQMMAALHEGRGRSRVFMVGIGSAPNTHLMSRMAETGKGSFTHIGAVAQVEDRMRDLFARLENPAVTGLALAGAEGAELTPDPLPDVYRGEPAVFLIRAPALPGEITLSGRIGERPWSIRLDLANAAPASGLARVFARRRITAIEAAVALREMERDGGEAAIVALGMEHGLVTRLTSLVAVDRTPSRPEGQPLTRADIPLNLPAGWDFEAVFGERRGGRAAPLVPSEDRADPDLRKAQFGGGLTRAIATAPKPVVLALGSSGPGVPLPATATLAELALRAGLLLLAAGLLLMRRPRRRAQ